MVHDFCPNTLYCNHFGVEELVSDTRSGQWMGTFASAFVNDRT